MENATRRFMFIAKEELKQEYSKFLAEYLVLGHMNKIEDFQKFDGPHFYIPHHAVIKNTSLITKLCVVFDGSCASSSGTSLKDTLIVRSARLFRHSYEVSNLRVCFKRRYCQDGKC